MGLPHGVAGIVRETVINNGMTLVQKPVGGCASATCPDRFGCPPGIAPDFVIRRHDIRPEFRVCVSDCGEPIDLEGLVLEVNMWALAKLKASIDANATYFGLADGIGFDQIMVGDVIIMDRVRKPEHMIVEGFDEDNRLVLVKRGYNGTTPSTWKKGSRMRIFRIMSAAAVTETVTSDIEQPDGSVILDQITESIFVYEWSPNDTCLPGCYWLEFKLLKMKGRSYFLPGGIWDGIVNRDASGDYYTGTIRSDSSVKLSYDSPNNVYRIPKGIYWADPVHLWDDGKYYTGTDHDDGSVPLDLDGIIEDPDGHHGSGVSGISTDPDNTLPSISQIACDISGISIISSGEVPPSSTPSFPDLCETLAAYNCGLGDGVEWVRRFPMDGEGFLVQIVDSPTAEMS